MARCLDKDTMIVVGKVPVMMMMMMMMIMDRSRLSTLVTPQTLSNWSMILGSQTFEIRNQNILTSLLSTCLEFCWGIGRCQWAQCLIHDMRINNPTSIMQMFIDLPILYLLSVFLSFFTFATTWLKGPHHLSCLTFYIIGCSMIFVCPNIFKSGQILATSHDLTPKCGWWREIPLFQK